MSQHALLLFSCQQTRVFINIEAAPGTTLQNIRAGEGDMSLACDNDKDDSNVTALPADSSADKNNRAMMYPS